MVMVGLVVLTWIKEHPDDIDTDKLRMRNGHGWPCCSHVDQRTSR